jgi:hypothetical protein
MPNEEVMTTGFLLAGFAWTLWWNLDWQRFIKFYGISNRSYPRIAIGLRVFFALCALGAAGGIGTTPASGTPAVSVLFGVPSRGGSVVHSYHPWG